ncbi:division/cell wall cluster transcriptional repressor MraZ [Calorimonas adulescens]|uniref:Transcriptional regulator MraZ n=1 Tax=Calorimonas adulescens TaxID=2606906 RepID=A0A5D8QEJ4_9THEO|nr:division/cell wall cluster transcriptional repressor MraZ [Calorimonas adulescens]TZE81943.1 division/cell wall cluster transcriptional repressor MraZ [Calorimonas adulescens]
MLIGEYRHTLDSKGRIIIPAKFRGELGEHFVMTKGLDGCLFVYPLSEWQSIEDKLRKLPMNKKDARTFERFFFSGAVECEMDNQGRVVIPQNLREYAGITNEVVIIGISTRVEIWSQDKWENYNNESDYTYEDIAERLEDIDL